MNPSGSCGRPEYQPTCSRGHSRRMNPASRATFGVGIAAHEADAGDDPPVEAGRAASSPSSSTRPVLLHRWGCDTPDSGSDSR